MSPSLELVNVLHNHIRVINLQFNFLYFSLKSLKKQKQAQSPYLWPETSLQSQHQCWVSYQNHFQVSSFSCLLLKSSPDFLPPQKFRLGVLNWIIDYFLLNSDWFQLIIEIMSQNFLSYFKESYYSFYFRLIQNFHQLCRLQIQIQIFIRDQKRFKNQFFIYFIKILYIRYLKVNIQCLFIFIKMQRKKTVDVGKKQKSVSPITKIYRSRSRTENKRVILKPKSVGKSQKIMNNKDHVQKPKEDKKVKSAQEIIVMISSLDIQHLSFDQLWNQFLSIVNDYLKINVIFPVHSNQIGEEILKDGRFILSWLKIIQKNGYVIQQIICKNVLEKYLPKIQKEQKELSIYVNEKMKRLLELKSVKKNDELKRSIIKNSQKKVRFSEKRQIYPLVEQYKTPVNYSSFKKLQSIKMKNKFLLDNFDFEKILSLDKVEIVGELKQYEEKFGIMIVKDKNTQLEYTCIGVLSQNVYKPEYADEMKKIIEDVKRQYIIQAYIELDGRKMEEVWINSLPDQKI